VGPPNANPTFTAGVKKTKGKKEKRPSKQHGQSQKREKRIRTLAGGRQGKKKKIQEPELAKQPEGKKRNHNCGRRKAR